MTSENGPRPIGTTGGEFIKSQEEAIISTLATLTIIGTASAKSGNHVDAMRLFTVAKGLAEIYLHGSQISRAELTAKTEVRCEGLNAVLQAEVRA